ncbi:MAG: hypothetical protein JNL52_05415 [Flavobacteriales bacterium]|nr:hypothetical protein [Flavobacteriales bacterium]
MRHLMSLLCLLSVPAMAQLGRKELRTDTGLVVLHHFRTGQVSTKEWRDPDDRFGRSIAYDSAGREIFSYHTRRIGGHASVYFSYHPNGAVSKAEVSDAPDAGIQWYRSTTTFDDKGNRTGFWEEGRDNYGPLHSPSRWVLQEEAPTVVTVPPKPAVVECQKLFVNEVYLVNATRQAGKATVKALRPSPALKDSEHTLAPGDTVRLGTYSVGERFIEPDTELTVDVRRALRNRRKPAAVGVVRTDSVQVNAEQRRYYLVVRGWGK